MSLLSIVIPVGKGDSPDTTLKSLSVQTFLDFEAITVLDEKGNANWARNRGFEFVDSPLVLFSDADINWLPQGIERLVNTLQANVAVSYAYGAYQVGNRVNSNRGFDAVALRRMNYISTMSVIHTEHFPGFDESIQRLQDWDLWLTMLEQGHVGVFCGSIVFTTAIRNGITHNGSLSWTEAERIVKAKHGL